MKHMMPKVPIAIIRPHLVAASKVLKRIRRIEGFIQSRANKQVPGHSSNFQCTAHSFIQSTK